jgi:hypothetical protein
MVDPKSGVSYAPLMDKICQMLGVRLNTKTDTKTKKCYFRVSCSSVASNSKLVSYLNPYPLFSSKVGSFNVWCQVFAKLKAKKAYAPEYAAEIKTLKHIINKDGQVCDELHLKKL